MNSKSEFGRNSLVGMGTTYDGTPVQEADRNSPESPKRKRQCKSAMMTQETLEVQRNDDESAEPLSMDDFQSAKCKSAVKRKVQTKLVLSGNKLSTVIQRNGK